MNKDDKIKALKAENKALKLVNAAYVEMIEELQAEFQETLELCNKSIDSDKKLMSELEYQYEFAGAACVRAMEYKNKQLKGFNTANANKKLLRDIATLLVPYYEAVAVQLIKQGVKEKTASMKARNAACKVVKGIIGKEPGKTLMYELYPAIKKSVTAVTEKSQ